MPDEPQFLSLSRWELGGRVFEIANDAYYQLVGHREILGRTVAEALPELENQGYLNLLDEVLTMSAHMAAATGEQRVVFSESDRSLIRQWAQGIRPGDLPPGLAKRGELPPGLQKQLQKRGTLPPGLEKKISPFPDDLVRRLGPLPADCGCDRIFLDGKALIVTRAANVILDVVILY